VIRKELGYNSKRSCTNRDIKFLEVVNQLGEPPKGQGKSKRVDSKEYWGNFISLWNKGNSEKYSN
jgi:hypothetical protein